MHVHNKLVDPLYSMKEANGRRLDQNSAWMNRTLLYIDASPAMQYDETWGIFEYCHFWSLISIC